MGFIEFLLREMEDMNSENVGSKHNSVCERALHFIAKMDKDTNTPKRHVLMLLFVFDKIPRTGSWIMEMCKCVKCKMPRALKAWFTAAGGVLTVRKKILWEPHT